MAKRWLTVKDACEYLGISRMTLLSAEEQGILAPVRTPGGHRRYTVEQLEQYLDAARQAELHPVMDGGGKAILPRFVERIAEDIGSREIGLAEAVRQLVLLLQGDWGALFLYDEQSGFRLGASFGVPKWVTRELPPLGPHSISQEAIRNRALKVFSASESDLPVTGEDGQGLCTPLVHQGKVLGVVHLFAAQRRHFFPSEINVFSTISIYLASLVFNLQLITQYQKRLNELLVLNRIATAMQGQAELDPLLETFLTMTLEAVGADAGVVLLYDEREGILRPRTARGYPVELSGIEVRPDEGITGAVIRKETPHVSLNLAADPLYSHRVPWLTEHIGSNICVPLKSAGQVLGAIHVSTRERRSFTEDEMRFLVTIASQAAVIVRRALLREPAGHSAISRGV